MNSPYDNKEIWKWILEQKSHVDLVNLAKKLKVKVPGFRSIDQKTPRFKIIDESIKKLLNISDRDNNDLFNMAEIENLDKGLISEKIRSDPQSLISTLECLLITKDVENYLIASNLYHEFVKQGEQENSSEKIEFLKRIEELENQNEIYQSRYNEYIKQNKSLEKQIEKLKASLQKKDNELTKLNKNLNCIAKEVEEKKCLILEIEKLKKALEDKDLIITKLKSLLEEKDSLITSLISISENSTIKKTNEIHSTNKNLNICLWIAKDSSTLKNVNVNKFTIVKSDSDEVILQKLLNVSELWYLDYEISIFMVRKLQKLLKNNNYGVKLSKFSNVNELKAMLKKKELV